MTLPRISSWCQNFGKPRVGWSFVEHDGDWSKSKYTFREVNDIKGDRAKWEAAKLELGKASVRFFRTAFYFALLLLIAGAIDIVSDGNYRGRGIVFVVIGLTAVPVCIALWAARHEKYVENLMWSLPENKRPPSYHNAIKA